MAISERIRVVDKEVAVSAQFLKKLDQYAGSSGASGAAGSGAPGASSSTGGGVSEMSALLAMGVDVDGDF